MYNMRMFGKNILILLFLLFTVSFANTKDKITLQLDWLHQFQFAGYYIAKEKGYYKENNLDVTINEFDYNVNLLDNVLKNKNSYSVGKSSLIIDRLQGKKVVLLAAIYQNSPMVLLSLKKSNIKTINDLKSKKIMLTPDARSAASINSMIKSQGVKLSEIDFIPHSFKLDDLINANTDAMGCYLSNEPYILKQKGIEFNTFNPKDYGFDFYGGILFTSQEELEKHPIRVKNFYEATIRGWKYAFDNIEETAQLIYDKYNTQNKTLDSLIFEGKVLKDLAKVEKGLLGNIDEKKIQELKRLYLVLGFSKNYDFKIEEFIFNKDKILFSDHEKEFIKSNDITLVTKANKVPYSYKTTNDILGMEIDIWSILENRLGTKFNIIESPENINILSSINTNSTHLEFNYNKENIDNTKYILTQPIMNISLAIATTSDKNLITDLSIFKNKKIVILRNKNLLKKLKEKYPNLEFIEVTTINEAFRLLREKKVFGFIEDILSLSHHINNDDLNNIKVTGTLPFDLELRLKANKGNEVIINVLNKIISQITQEEKNSITHKYQLVLYKEVNDYSWIYKFLLPLFVILVIITLVNNKMRKEIKRRKHAEKALLDYANRDSLTQVFNRRKIEKIMTSQIRNTKEADTTFSIIFFDIDDFKIINDNFGHVRGDKVLITISSLVSANIRKSDFIGRWGGEEFIIILPNTNIDQAHNIAKNLKELICKTDFHVEKTVTSSFGITQFRGNKDNKKDMIKRADEAMYYVKRNGKNAIKLD